MAPKPKRIIVQRTADRLDDTLAYLQRGPLAVDTETTGLDWTQDAVGSINLAAGETAVFAYQDALAPVARWLGDQVKRQRELVFHHAKFDLHFLRESFGLHVPYPVHDTKIQSFCLDNRGVHAPDISMWKDSPHSLKPLAVAWVDPDAQDHETELLAQIKAAGGRNKADWLLAPEKYFAKYAAYDPWYTLQLHLQQIERIKGWVNPPGDYDSLASYYETERWLILAFRDMEERGIWTDREFFEQWKVELAAKLEVIKKKLWKLAGKREINWNSAPQLRDLLFNKLKLIPMRYTDGGKTGNVQPSTDEVALLTLRHPIGAAMVEYRETFKQWSSYATSLLEARCEDGAIRCTFKSDGAGTSRTSCEDPNLQQQTRESGVRRAYKPRKGLKFRFADLSQVEMRFAAHFANERSLIKGFNEDPDFDTHRSTAIQMYGVPAPSERQRKFGKILNFTTLFGGGENKVAEQLRERMKAIEALQALRELHYELQPGEDPHQALAHHLKTRYNQGMPNMRRATREAAEIAEAREFVMTTYGYHRYIEGRWYRAFNTQVQGSAGSHAKQALAKVYREKQLRDGALACLLLIHDEIVYESDGDPQTDRDVLELMADRSRFRVPIIADLAGSDTSWQEKKKIKV